MAPKDPPSQALRALPYVLYGVVLAAAAAVCVHFRGRLPDPYVTSSGSVVSVASQYAVLFALLLGLVALKIAPLVAFGGAPHTQRHKQALLRRFLPLSARQKTFWLDTHAPEFARIEAWLVLDALLLAPALALDILLGFVLAFVDAANRDPSYAASQLHLLPHALLCVLAAPIGYVMFNHARELLVDV